MKVTVKITPKDGNWTTARNLIKQITAEPIGEMEFFVEDVFKASSDKPVDNSTNHFGVGNQIVTHNHGVNNYGNV